MTNAYKDTQNNTYIMRHTNKSTQIMKCVQMTHTFKHTNTITHKQWQQTHTHNHTQKHTQTYTHRQTRIETSHNDTDRK